MNEYTIDQIYIGLKKSFKRVITTEMENQFREISGDYNPLHRDDKFAIETGKGRFKSHISFGMLTASMYSTMAGMYLPGKYSLIHSIDKLSFLNPVYVGDELEVSGIVTDKNTDLGLIVLKVEIKNQESLIVSKAKMKVLLMTL